MTTEPVSPQYQKSVKIEDTKDGPRVTVHVYGELSDETRERAVSLYKQTRADLEKTA